MKITKAILATGIFLIIMTSTFAQTKEQKVVAVFLGHTRDDQAETVLLGLVAKSYSCLVILGQKYYFFS